jgi:hypothetical protein
LQRKKDVLGPPQDRILASWHFPSPVPEVTGLASPKNLCGSPTHRKELQLFNLQRGMTPQRSTENKQLGAIEVQWIVVRVQGIASCGFAWVGR